MALAWKRFAWRAASSNPFATLTVRFPGSSLSWVLLLAGTFCPVLVSGSEGTGVERPCHVPAFPHEARCGAFPLNASGAMLRYVRLPARARHPLPDPVIHLLPGPSTRAQWATAQAGVLYERVRNHRDIIIPELGRSQGLREECRDDSPTADLQKRLDPASFTSALLRCHARLGGDGQLTRSLSLEQAVDELEQLRGHLGVARLNLTAQGRGTLIAHRYASRHPGQVNSLVLDPAPHLSDDERAAHEASVTLQRLVDRCAASRLCRQRHPDWAGRLQALLLAPPRDARLPHPVTGDLQGLRWNSAVLRQILLSILPSAEATSSLPAAVDLAHGGDVRGLVGLASLGWNRGSHTIAYLTRRAVCEDPPWPVPPVTSDPWGLIAHAQTLAKARCAGLTPATAGAMAQVSHRYLSLEKLGLSMQASTGRLHCIGDVIHRHLQSAQHATPGPACAEPLPEADWPLLQESPS